MTHYVISCPHCGKTIEKGTDRASRYGSPFRTCRFCHKTYIDKGYKEAGLLSKTDFKRIAAPWGLLSCLFFAALVLAVGSQDDGSIWMMIIGGILLLVGLIPVIVFMTYNPDKDENLQREIKESYKRLKKPEYVISLRRAGYNVPEKGLAQAREHMYDGTEEDDDLSRLIKAIMANKNNQK